MYLSKKDIQNLNRIKRLNLINSLSGIQPVNLIGTMNNGVSNLAIFNSVMHIGSSPALMGFIMRPDQDIRRDTLINIVKTGEFTINHVSLDKLSDAHQTSAKYPRSISEFNKCGFTEQFLEGYSAPFVRESLVQIGMSYVKSIPIDINKTQLIIGEVEHIFIPENSITEEGYLELEILKSTGVCGLNSYYQLSKIRSYPYSRV